jgi:hypothetical protein
MTDVSWYRFGEPRSDASTSSSVRPAATPREWDDQRRRDFANDPRNLLAISATANFDKAFRDANAGLPPNQAFRCEFVARQVSVKVAYRLWVSANAKRAMAAVLDHC